MEIAPHRFEQFGDETVEWGRVAPYGGFEGKALAFGEHRHAVVAERPADEHSVTGKKIVNADAEVMLDDKTLLTGTVTAGDPGAMKIESPVIRETAPIDLARVSYINPPPEVSGRGLKLNARVNVGAARYTGNTDTQTVHVDGEAVAELRDLQDPAVAGDAAASCDGRIAKPIDPLTFADTLRPFLERSAR